MGTLVVNGLTKSSGLIRPKTTENEWFRSSRQVFYKKSVLKISQKSQENTCARVSFLIRCRLIPATLLKKRLWHRCFIMNFKKFLRTAFLKRLTLRRCPRAALEGAKWLIKERDREKTYKLSNLSYYKFVEPLINLYLRVLVYFI